MTQSDHDYSRMPRWCWLAPVAAALFLLGKYAHLYAVDNALTIPLAVLLLGGAVFAAVHHAEVLAVRIGDPFGAILLALAITIIEVGLVVSVMLGDASGTGAVARDTVYAVAMIVLNGIVGLCLVVGGAHHHHQAFGVQGAASMISVITVLAVVALVLPNFTLTTPGPTYASSQLLFVSAISLGLYGLFIFVQTVRHRADYLAAGESPAQGHEAHAAHAMPGPRLTALSALLLVISLLVVIFLAKTLSPLVELAVRGAGLPLSVVGVVIAAVVLLPEGLTAVKAARRNRLQTSLNASLGSVLASIGLTIPIVGAVAVAIGQPLTLGLSAQDMVLLALTLVVSQQTLSTGRTTIMQGAVHLGLFGVFLCLVVVP